jgi:hypothetical protein
MPILDAPCFRKHARTSPMKWQEYVLADEEANMKGAQLQQVRIGNQSNNTNELTREIMMIEQCWCTANTRIYTSKFFSLLWAEIRMDDTEMLSKNS